MVRSLLLMVLLNLFSYQPKSPEDFVWQNRILIINSKVALERWPIEHHSQKLDDRNLLVFQFNQEKLLSTNCRDQIDAARFLKKLNKFKGEDIQWVLIGLDGGIKKSGKENPNPEEIFKIIDAMPMRQSEIRKSTIGIF